MYTFYDIVICLPGDVQYSVNHRDTEQAAVDFAHAHYLNAAYPVVAYEIWKRNTNGGASEAVRKIWTRE
jgi:hypothetical protein